MYIFKFTAMLLNLHNGFVTSINQKGWKLWEWYINSYNFQEKKDTKEIAPEEDYHNNNNA